FVVRFEHERLCALVERLLEEDEEPTDGHVFPTRVTGHAPRAPHAEAAALRAQIPQHVDVPRIEDVLLALADVQLKPGDAPDHLVRGRLVDAALVVGSRVDAGEMAARWDDDLIPGQGILDPQTG